LAAATGASERDANLSANCARCVGLCCVALAFARSRDFAFSKDAGDPCRNLADDYRCEIHPTLRRDGFRGCTVFDCHGAGQKVTQVVFAGRSWRDDEKTRVAMFGVFPIVCQLHEMLWYLYTATMFAETRTLSKELDAAYLRIETLSKSDADEILRLDMDAARNAVNAVLARASVAIRATASAARTTSLPPRFRSGADLVGAHLAGLDLRGADLSTSAFVTQMQLNAAIGNAATALPMAVIRPSHWR
jgi:hypothetical protein